jgi:hypothetical protein
MVIAALISFAVLLLAWIVAPEHREPPAPEAARVDDEREPLPLAA